MLLVLLLLSVSHAADLMTFTPPEDDQAVLRNADMGWVLYENYPVDPRPSGASTLVNFPDENFDAADHVAVMFTWADVERAEGDYDFRDVDHAYGYWRARGKQIQLRMSTESLIWWSTTNPPRGAGVPRWLLDRIPPARKQRLNAYGFDYDAVDARDPLYLDRLSRFLAAVAKHFDDKRPVTLIDLRGFGLWGEWHTGYRYATAEDRIAALRTVIDRWSDAFPKHHLALCYSHDPDGPPQYFTGSTKTFDPEHTTTYRAFLAYSAFDHAMTKPNVTLRRDGAGGAVYSNQRKLCDEAFATLAKGPMSSEFASGYADAKRGGAKWLDHVINDALSLHPNYINLLGWQTGDALAFTREQPALVARGLREMGYRLVPTRVTLPRKIKPREPFGIKMTWTNRAAGRAMRDYHLRVIARDETIDAGPLETSRWIKGQIYEVSKEISLATDIEPSAIRIALIDPATAQPIALPLHNRHPDGSYPIGNRP